ncbi:hypothetical protein NYO98_10540 [Nocardioides sp. STR2]|uniref:Uncharacterized protein n=1 Tax=Nocardioides pini TaxID=2975053 RepID=A0ABT4CEB4_9ACTN|nr:hypothetical protein [Nocardioides pini]MCY4726716.1 hypothetical protein [Nocardioides pini]
MSHRIDTDGRCVMSDLPPGECAASACRPDATETNTDERIALNEMIPPSQIRRRTSARAVSIVSCGHHAHPGMTIALGPNGWVCDECDPRGLVIDTPTGEEEDVA